MERLKIGTRGSLLALRQCYGLMADLQVAHWTATRGLLGIDITPIRTAGDRAQGTSQAGTLSKKAWVEDIETALLAGDIDIAIHSGKDLPHDIASGTRTLPVGKREYPRDVFVGRLVDDSRIPYSMLGAGMTIGTKSTRRARFLQAAFPGLRVVAHDGNVPTRLQKLDGNPQLAGIILAEAGIRRLGLDLLYEVIPASVLTPAMNQGTLVAQIRTNDVNTERILQYVLDPSVLRSFEIERAIAAELAADCNSCVGIYAEESLHEFSATVTAASSTGQLVSIQERASRVPDGSTDVTAVKQLLEAVLKEARARDVVSVMRA